MNKIKELKVREHKQTLLMETKLKETTCQAAKQIKDMQAEIDELNVCKTTLEEIIQTLKQNMSSTKNCS